MAEMYGKINLQAAQSAEAQIAAMQTVRAESAGTAAQVIGNNVRVTESTGGIVGANEAVIASERAKGAAAMAAGAQSISASEAAAAAARMQAGAVETVAAANAAAGASAVSAGATTVTAMGTATRMVRGAASAVFALAGGWLGVAAAIGYAAYKLWEYNKEQKATREKNT